MCARVVAVPPLALRLTLNPKKGKGAAKCATHCARSPSFTSPEFVTLSPSSRHTRLLPSPHIYPPPPPTPRRTPESPSRGGCARGKERERSGVRRRGSPLLRVCSCASSSDNVRHASLLPREDFKHQGHKCGAAGLERLRRNRSHRGRIRPRRRPRRRRSARGRGRLGGPGW